MQVAEFIMNINDLYKPPLNQGQQKFYNQFLNRFTGNQLDELWELTMEKHLNTSAPTIGRLKEYSKEVTPVRVVNSEEQKKLDLKNLTDEEIFSTELGRLSLKQGWGDSYRITCRERGIPQQDDDDKILLWFQKTQHNANMAVYDLRGKNDVFSKALMNFKNSMDEKNEGLKQEYAHLIDNGIAIAAP